MKAKCFLKLSIFVAVLFGATFCDVIRPQRHHGSHQSINAFGGEEKEKYDNEVGARFKRENPASTTTSPIKLNSTQSQFTTTTSEPSFMATYWWIFLIVGMVILVFIIIVIIICCCKRNSKKAKKLLQKPADASVAGKSLKDDPNSKLSKKSIYGGSVNSKMSQKESIKQPRTFESQKEGGGGSQMIQKSMKSMSEKRSAPMRSSIKQQTVDRTLNDGSKKSQNSKKSQVSKKSQGSKKSQRSNKKSQISKTSQVSKKSQIESSQKKSTVNKTVDEGTNASQKSKSKSLKK